jgi:hypothetical protein
MRQPELKIKRARGFLLIVAILVLVVIAVAIAAMGNMISADIRASSGHAQSEQAYFAATSGVEFAANRYFNGTDCTALNTSGATVGNASFTLTPTLYVPSNAPTNALTATTGALTAASNAIAVSSTAGYAPNGRILIDAELIDYTSTTATSFNGISRGAGGTAAAVHAAGATVSQNVCTIASTGSASGGSAVRKLNAAIGSGTMANAGALGTMGPDAMIAYAKGTALTGAGSDSNVYFRLWDSSTNNWNASESTAQPASATPVFIVVQFARTRNEAIMGVLDGNNRIYIQIWNGRTWTIPAGGNPLATASTNTTRNFQIAYEYTTDHAMIVYQNNTSAPQYATWDGNSLTANGPILPSGAAYPITAGGHHLWFRLAPRNVAGSNDILLMTVDDNQDVYGVRWTGAAWNNMGNNARWDTTTSNANNRESIDVAWQSNGTLALFTDGDATTRQIGYRTWNTSTSTLTPTGNGSANSVIRLTYPAGCATAGSVYEWVRQYPDPNNNILVMLQTSNRCLLSYMWTGSFPAGTATQHDGTNGVESAASRSFDFAWETLPNSSAHGWLIWGSTLVNGMLTKYFTSPAAWGGTSTIRDHTLLVQAAALSPSGRFVAGAYRSTAAVLANRLTESVIASGGGTAWPNAATTLWAGPTTLQQGERVFVMERNSGFTNAGASGTGIVKVLQMQENY